MIVALCVPPVRTPSWICHEFVPVDETVAGVLPSITAEKAETGTVVVGAGEREKLIVAGVP